MSMIEELRMVREALFSMIVEGKSNTFEAQEAYAKLGSIIEQMEKAEPVGHFKRAYGGQWTQLDPDCWPNGSEDSLALYTHPAPTPDETAKLREQLAAVTAELEFQRNAHRQSQELLLEQGQQLAATQAEVEALRGVMQQAREALVDSVDLVREDYLTDWRHGIPTRAAQLEGKKAELDRHEQTIAAIDAAIDAAMQPAADEAGKGK